jgi:hypothetical protein
MRTIYIEIIIAGLICFSVTCDVQENKAGVQLAATIPGGCNDKAILRNDNVPDKDTIIISTINE